MPSSPIVPPTASNQPISPEDDATLQAIEALEARTVDPDPEPYTPSASRRPAPAITPKPVVAPIPVAPKVMEPVLAKAAVAATTVISAPPETPAAPQPVKPSVPKTPAIEIAEELANAPATSPEDAPFQPFPKRKPSKKSLLAIVGVIVIIGLIIGGYFGWQSLHSS
ncbi:MAG: hypothetical protein JWO99_273 [Candidatus Saccharibacteria bacterium]|nr:hypothetical protein [Candidatus Saccharibacteria bacterium]